MRELTADERVIAIIDSFEQLEYKCKSAIIGSFDNPSRLLEDSRILGKYVGDKGLIGDIIRALKDRQIGDNAIEKSVGCADGLITILSKEYPEELKNIPSPPIVLYYKGDITLLKQEYKVGIVGSRKTLSPYIEKAKQIAESLCDGGATIVTGIAEGADRSAIEGSINRSLISVLPGGIDRVYPKNHNALVDKISMLDLVITEHRAGTVPKFYMFPVRNRIIAGLSKAVLIVSGREGGGARYTAGYALDYGREVCCLPYGISVPSGELNKSLIKSGAHLVESANEIAEVIGLELRSKPVEISLSEKEKCLYSLIKEHEYQADALVEVSGMKIFEIMPVLSMLEIKGLIVKSGQEYSAVK